MKSNIFYSAFFGILLSISVSGRAQSLRGEFNMSAYPEISFVWNEYNPEIKDSTQFLLTGDGKRIPFQLQHLPYSDTVKRNKTILFLWEDLDHPLHKGQSEFTQQFLYQFLQQTSVREGDRFNVAVFDRKGGNDFGSSIHTLLSDSFTSNKELLAQAVQNFSHKYDFFSKQVSSELYMAIEEGINLLSKEPADRVRALVVITAGSNQDKHGGKGDFADVKAVELKIPIYLVKYPVPHCEHCTNIDGISARTFGKQIETADTAIALNLLKECFNKMNEQHYGQDYRVSFLTEYPPDGNQHLISWNVNGKEYPLTYIAPSFSFVDWLKEHTLLVILTAMGVLLLLATTAFFIVRAIRKKKRKKEIEEEKIRKEIEEKQKKADDEINRLKRNIEEKEKNAEEQRKNEYEKDLLNIMQTKNFFPHLQYIINGANMSFTIRHPFTTIGRSKDNHLIIPAESVSRKHAQIIFTGNGFEIQDLGSANKVIVNGRPVQRTTLNNGDTVKLGEIILYFYN